MQSTNSLSNEIWIQDLAFAEKNAAIGKLIDNHNIKELIEKHTSDFLEQLKFLMQQFCSSFNALSEKEQAFPEVKIYQLAQSTLDFMLYRNRYKMFFKTQQAGIIHIGFSEPFVPHLPCIAGPAEYPGPIEIIAQIGPFHEVFWTFQGEKVDLFALGKYHFSQFILVTRIQKDNSSNQVLFDQIRAFLEQKGLHI